MIKICNSYTNQFWAKTLTAISPAFTKKILSCITKLGFLLKYKTTANQARSDIETFFKRKPLFNYVEIETFNRCNGTCSFCPVNRNLDPRPLTKMSEKTFYKIIDNLSKLNFCGTISYYSNNEPIMDARIVEFIRYGVKKNPNANHSMISNGTLLNEEKFQALIDAGLNNLEISNYNDKLKLNENIKKIYDKYKNEKFSMNCKISLRLNNQILSNRGGTAPNKFPPPPPPRRKNSVDAQCFLPFHQLIIRADCGVSLCCNDALGKITLGNVEQQTLEEIWYGEKHIKILEKIRDNMRNDIEICKLCDIVSSSKNFMLFKV